MTYYVFKRALVSVGVSVTAGLACVTFFGYAEADMERFIGLTLVFAALLLGFDLAECVISARRGASWVSQAFVVSLGSFVAVLVTFVALGFAVSPVIGDSDNRILFPSLFLVGFAGGLAGRIVSVSRWR